MTQFDDVTIEKIFGADDAENEDPTRFKEYFYRNRAYDSLVSDLSARILVGHKGIGKSALLKRAYLDDQEKGLPSIWLRPNDIVDVRTAALAKSDFILRIEEWKRGLLLEAIQDFFLKNYGQGSREVVSELTNTKPRDLSRILEKALTEKADGNPINIYIDDIDRAWSASSDDIRNISALLNAIRDIGGEFPKIRFRMGLRSDVYFLVRTSDESTDKIERNIIWLRWTNDEILRLAAKRVVSYFSMKKSDAEINALSQRQMANLGANSVESHYTEISRARPMGRSTNPFDTYVYDASKAA